MKYGLTEEQFSILEELLIKPLKQKGVALWIFGSRARGDFKEFSDVDILFAPKAPLEAGFLSEIKEELEESRLPYKVDLVNLADLAESYRSGVLNDRRNL